MRSTVAALPTPPINPIGRSSQVAVATGQGCNVRPLILGGGDWACFAVQVVGDKCEALSCTSGRMQCIAGVGEGSVVRHDLHCDNDLHCAERIRDNWLVAESNSS